MTKLANVHHFILLFCVLVHYGEGALFEPSVPNQMDLCNFWELHFWNVLTWSITIWEETAAYCSLGKTLQNGLAQKWKRTIGILQC